MLTSRTGIGLGGDGPALQRSFGAVVLEGPGDVARAAGELVDCLRRNQSLDDLERANLDFISVAQGRFDPPVPGSR